MERDEAMTTHLALVGAQCDSGRPDLSTVLAGFEDELRSWGASPATVKSRIDCVQQFAAQSGRDPRDADRATITAWLGTPGWSASTRATYFGHLRSWYAWLVDTGRLEQDPTRGLRRAHAPRGVPRPVPDAAVRAMLDQAGPRVRTYVVIAAFAGLRVHEIAKIRGEDVAQDLIYVRGKGGGIATVPTHPLVWAETDRYPPRGWWFPASNEAGHVQGSSVSAGIRRLMERVGVDGTPHALRHSFGTNVLRSAGGNLRVAQQALRHANVATTAIYTRVDDADLRAAVLGLSDHVTGTS